MEIRLDNKVILITGATGRLGEALTRACVKEGAIVCVNFLNNRDKAEELAALGARTYQADVSELQQVDRMVDAISKEFGRIDCLINNAGVVRDNLMVRMKEDEWDYCLKVNLKGVFNCTNKVLRIMIRQKQGRIVNISSFVGLRGAFGQANYSASKAAIIASSKSVAQEVGRFNVQVNAVCPGYFLSGINKDTKEELKQAAKDASLLNKFADPEEVADFIVYLLSDKMQGVTGQVFVLDSRPC